MSPSSPPDDRETRTYAGGARRLVVGERVAGRYRVAEVLGVGAMGAVYRVHDDELDVEVALKALRPELAEDPEVRERFRREIVLSRQISHPNVVRIHDIGHDEGITFLTMDLVEGRSLRSILDAEGSLGAERATEIAAGIASGLAAAHRRGVVHRDLKPDNVLVDEQGAPRIVDFGVAYAAGSAGLTETGMLVGTLSYLSPEQAAGGAVDQRSDLYALGLVFHEMLTGELPFRRSSQQEMLAQRMVASPRLDDLGEGVEPRVATALAGLLAREPGDRFQTAEELLDVLGGGGPPAGSAERRPPRRAIRRVGIAAVAAGALLVIALAWLGLRSWNESSETGGAGEDPAGGLPDRSVAVLPFEDETGTPELAWVSRGVAEMVAEELAGSPGLQVADSVRVFRVLRDLELAPPWSDTSLRNLSALLGADRLVTGRVRSLGDGLQTEVRVRAPALPDPRGEPLRLEPTAVRELPEAAARLARGIAERLAVPPPMAGEPMELSPEARASYDEGLDRWVRGDALGAVEHLEAAVDEEPALTRGWMLLSDAHAALGRYEEAEEALETAERNGVREGSRRSFELRLRKARLTGDVDQAIALSEELVSRYPGDVEARVVLASILGEAGDLERARRGLETVVERAPKHPRAWYLLAKYSIQAGEAEKAVEDYLVRALVLQNELENDQGRADVLNAMGVAYDHLGRFEEAVSRYREAAEIRERIGDRRGLATSLRNLSAIHAVLGEMAAAEEDLVRAEEILTDLGDRPGLAELANDQGLLAEEQGRYREALEAYRRGLALRRELGDRRGIAESAYNVSFVYYQLGELDNAHAFARQAVDLFEEGGVPEGLIFARQMLATLEVARGAWSEAAALFHETLEASRELGMKDTTAVALGGLGDVALLQGDLGGAARLVAQAAEVVEELGDQRGRIEFALDRAEIRVRSGQAAEARSLLDEAEEWLEGSGNREQTARHLRLRGEIALLAGRPDEARRLAASARDEAVAGHAELARLEAERAIGEALGTSRPEEAIEELSALLAEVELMGHLPMELAALESLARAEIAAGRFDDAVRRLRSALRQVPGGGYEGRYRLLHLLATALEATGEAEEATRRRDAARLELERIRKSLPEGAEEAFSGIPAVAALEEEPRAA